jgi:hypothetical protein
LRNHEIPFRSKVILPKDGFAPEKQILKLMGYQLISITQLLIRLFAASPHYASFHFASFGAFRFYPASIGRGSFIELLLWNWD